MNEWTDDCKQAVIEALQTGEELWVNFKELLELHKEGWPVKVIRKLGAGKEYIVRFVKDLKEGGEVN